MKCYICLHKNENVQKNSSSGGAFTAITDYFFEKYEKVTIYGCVLADNMKAHHISCSSKSERDLVRGSKYIQSDTSNVYDDIIKKLKNDEIVIYTGTPCQIQGLINVLKFKRIKMDNLWTVDFICHGVGSPTFFREYINYLESKYKSKASLCKFRGKSKPGKIQDMNVEFINGKKYIASTTSLDLFYSAYLKNYILRESCYNCIFTNINRISDFKIADDWSKNRNEEVGYSQIILNTHRSEELINYLNLVMYSKEISPADLNQPNLIKSIKCPEDYDEFWKKFHEKGFVESEKYLGNLNLKYKIKLTIANLVDRLNLRKIVKKIKR